MRSERRPVYPWAFLNLWAELDHRRFLEIAAASAVKAADSEDKVDGRLDKVSDKGGHGASQGREKA